MNLECTHGEYTHENASEARLSREPRFSRLLPMVGPEGLTHLNNARVIVFGLGGVGGACAEALTRNGIGTLVLVDGDAVEESNLNRQAIAFASTIGFRKVDAAEKLIHAINPTCSLELHDCFVQPHDAGPFLDACAAQDRIDYIIDCIDTADTKLELAAWAEQAEVPYIGCAGTARKFDAARFEFANIYDTSVCPLCRVLRREARKRGIERMEVLYSNERPFVEMAFERETRDGTPFDAEESAESSQSVQPMKTMLGTMSYVPPIAGMLIAGRVIRHIAHI